MRQSVYIESLTTEQLLLVSVRDGAALIHVVTSELVVKMCSCWWKLL